MQIIHSLLWGVATPGKLGSSQAFMFFIFDLIKSILFLVNCISLHFFHVLLNITILCLLILSPPGDSGWTVGVDQLRNSSTVSRRAIVQVFGTSFFRASFTSFYAHASLLAFFSFSVLFHFCCSHAQVFGKTLVHEFLISYSHTERYLISSDSATTSAHCVFLAKNQKQLCTSKPVPLN